MQLPLLTVNLRRRADLVRVRHHGRQIARLLGFPLEEQASIAAAVFEIGHRAQRPTGRAVLYFHLTRDALQIFASPLRSAPPARSAEEEQAPEPREVSRKLRDRREARRWLLRLHAASPDAQSLLRLDKPLPPGERDLEREDLAWMVRQLAAVDAPSLYEEVRQQNQELLQALHELQACRAQLAQVRKQPDTPSAA
jgi:anti-sigma regulatory factor (Ser/Thr protein kinase)